MEKKELVILAGACYPISSATGSLAIKFGKALSANYNVSIIAIEQDEFSYDGTKIEDFNVYTITNWRLKLAQKSKNKRDNSVGFKSRFFGLQYYLLRAVGRLQATFLYLNNNKWYINKAYKRLLFINSKSKIDLILTCAAPHESLMAGAKFKAKFPEVKWISYWGDLLATKSNKLNFFISMDRMKTIERTLCNACDYNLTTEENYQILLDETINKEKVKYMPYLLNQEALDRFYEPITDKTDKITLIYMGSFYRDIRNPEYFLRLMTCLEFDFQLLLYSTGDCEDIVDSYIQKSKRRIIRKKLVPKSKLVNELKRADFLINIENNVENTNPSKLLELISFGKPIIDFSYSNSLNKTLKSYPNSININMCEDIEISRIIIEEFIHDNLGKRVRKEYIINQYKRHLESSVNETLIKIILNKV